MRDVRNSPVCLFTIFCYNDQSENLEISKGGIMSSSYINVIGAGLAGSEAAYQIAKRGIPVKIYEMRG